MNEETGRSQMCDAEVRHRKGVKTKIRNGFYKINNALRQCDDLMSPSAPSFLSDVTQSGLLVDTTSGDSGSSTSESSIDSDDRSRSRSSTSSDRTINSDSSIGESRTCGSLSPVLSESKSNTEDVIFEFNFKQVVFLSLGAPLIALLASFIIGLTTDYKLLLNYEWTCGRVHLPSFSRIINLSKERIVWNSLVLFHVSLRPALVFMNYRICRTPASPTRFISLYRTLAMCILISGLAEIFLVTCLTVIGEREKPEMHVSFFTGFSISSIIYFLLTSLMFRNSLHYTLSTEASLSFTLKLIFTISYLILIPAMGIFFILYWKLCYNFAYDFFASIEYITILVNFAFHATALLDSNDVYQIKVQRSGKYV